MDKINMLAVSYGYVGFCLSASECGKTSLASWVLVDVEEKQLIMYFS